MYPAMIDELTGHRAKQMREDAARQRRVYRLAAVRRWERRAARAAHRARIVRDSVL